MRTIIVAILHITKKKCQRIRFESLLAATGWKSLFNFTEQMRRHFTPLENSTKAGSLVGTDGWETKADVKISLLICA